MSDAKKELVSRMMGDIEFYPSVVEEEIDLNDSQRIPWGEILTLGASVAPLAEAFQSAIPAAPEAAGTLYRAVIEGPGHLAVAKGGGFRGTVLSDATNKIIGQARFEAVEGAAGTLNPISFNPAMMIMAVALVGIEHKLGEIEKNQKGILDYLKADDKAGLKADFSRLTDIINNYKYNWDNDIYRKNNHSQVLDVLQRAQKSLIKHRDLIRKQIEKKKIIQFDKDVKDKFKNLQEEIQDYQLAVYLYGMASYLDVMMAESFNSVYINNIIDKINSYSIEYRETYTRIYDILEKEGKKTVESTLIGGLGAISKASGKAVAKVPLVNKTRLDENLIDTGRDLRQKKGTHGQRQLKRLTVNSNAHVQPFIDNLKAVDNLFNKPVVLMFDKENLYIKGEEPQNEKKSISQTI